MTIFGIAGLWVFSNRQIRCLYLLSKKGAAELHPNAPKLPQMIGLETYTNFGLTYNRLKTLPVEQLKGNRMFGTPAMNLFQLEYAYESKWAGITKRRSFFYRPEKIENRDLW